VDVDVVAAFFDDPQPAARQQATTRANAAFKGRQLKDLD
jgi:hypothetical protein